MKTVTATTLKAFEWRGQSYAAGQAITTSLLDAVALAKRHHITLTRRKAKPVELPQPIPEPPVVRKPKRGRYARRDIQPDEMVVLEPQAPVEPQD